MRLEVIYGCSELIFRLKLEYRVISKGDIQNVRGGYEVFVGPFASLCISNELLYEIWIDVRRDQLL
ncbi:hypothetical protein [Haloarchaeobius sp. HRN-SO-5]|uniref:hypothetical protein n=1 Tax=Haloarchaeobius sp. HRN-SO-5 TaxID=3446118 RepID=UPI003EBD4C4F